MFVLNTFNVPQLFMNKYGFSMNIILIDSNFRLFSVKQNQFKKITII